MNYPILQNFKEDGPPCGWAAAGGLGLTITFMVPVAIDKIKSTFGRISYDLIDYRIEGEHIMVKKFRIKSWSL
jgi:hypothetical protein